MSVYDNEDAPEPVRFDRANPSKVIAHSVAQEMLMAWRERNPAQFGYWLAAALTGAEPSKAARAQGTRGRG